MKKIILTNLDCANCAQKIENQLKKRSDVTYASINFVSKTLTIDCENTNDIINFIKEIEPFIEPFEKLSVTSSLVKKSNSKKWIPIICSILFVLIAWYLIDLNDGIKMFSPLFAVLAWFIAGRKVIFSAFRNIKNGILFDENFLMTIATLAAFIIGETLEAASVMIFFQIGEYFQELAVEKSRKSIGQLVEHSVQSAALLSNDKTIIVNADTLKRDDIILLKPGEKCPIDGTILKGEGYFDTKALTGEALPRHVKENDKIISGFIVLHGVFQVKVDESVLLSTQARINKIVEKAEESKTKTEQFITVFSKYYTPIVVLSSVILAFILRLFFIDDTFLAIKRALVFLVISCPCALVISIPLAYFGGIGAAARRGILLKSSSVFDSLVKVKAVVLDKTGTLTHGDFNVKQITTCSSFNEDEVLYFAAHVETGSNHPHAKAIIKFFAKDISLKNIKNHEEFSGYGVAAIVDGKTIKAGNHKLLHKENINHVCMNDDDELQIHIAIDGNHVGSITMGDSIKKESSDSIKDLLKNGIEKVYMLSGDNDHEVKKVALLTGIVDYKSSLLPEDKINELTHIMEIHKGGTVIYAGDGINDMPSLAQADIGIAMGMKGQDAAIEIADIVLLDDSPKKINEAIIIAGKTRKIVIQNIIFALGVKVLFLIGGGFGLAGMQEAVIADVGVALLAVLNSSRIIGSKAR